MARRVIRARRRRAVHDGLILGGYGLLVASSTLPWYAVLDYRPRPLDLAAAGPLLVGLGVLAVLVLVPTRLLVGRVLLPVPFGLGCLTLGIAVCLGATAPIVNALVDTLVRQRAEDIADRLSAWIPVPGIGRNVEAVQTMLLELPRRLTVGLEPGYWVFLCGAIVLLVAGYLRLVRGGAAADRGERVAEPGEPVADAIE
jgi:hypothetical protein